INNPNTVIKDALNAAIAAGLAKAEAAQVGIEVGEFYMTDIENFKTLMAEFKAKGDEVSEQDACDELTAEVEKAVEEFIGNTEIQAAAAVLADFITHCEALYEAEKDNVGDNLGQRPQEVVDAFFAAINAAKAVESANVNDLRALIDARDAFISGSVSVNRTPLREAIAKAEGEAYANLVAGDFEGQYPAETISTFNEALAAAKEADTDTTMTQEEVSAAATALTQAMAALDKARVTIDFKAFDAALEAAKTALAGATVVGDGEGACPQSVYDALKNVIEKAEAIDRAAVNQDSVNATAATLTEETSTFTVKLHESTGLEAVINTAKELVDDADQGLTPGCYPVSAISGLNEAIAAAEAVNADASATQAQLLDAVRALNEAMISFKAQQIPANDLTEINATIAEAEAFIAETGCDDFVLSSALDYAKDVVANADNYTKAQVKKANDELREALEFAKETGVDAIAAEGIVIRTAAGEVIVEGINEAHVVIYSIDGRVIANELTEGAPFTKALSAGAYVVTVNAEGTVVTRTVIVK
ncbi:MAG: T9SS type A sorting domain-containing protein, partial [Muribaculaceae bacterium]|nr:T9SS type A sorting domain-containing protein [Muribaculaceae bacterium]